jgi:hypothetical protein
VVAMDGFVWYACYGSNLWEKRFRLYIQGGHSNFIDKIYTGCTDKTPPVKSRQYRIHHVLYFSQTSSIWENKGVAFVSPRFDSSVTTLSKIYLITRSQFEQVFLQENGLDPGRNSVNLDFDKIKDKGQLIINEHWYGRIIYIGEKEGCPILTFTAPWEDDEIQPNPPGIKYLTVIVKGIKECFNMTDEDIIEYLSNISGIKNFIDKQRLFTIITNEKIEKTPQTL